jgi:hypothetical protein
MRSGFLLVIRLVRLIAAIGFVAACGQSTAPDTIQVSEIIVAQDATIVVGGKINLMVTAKGPELQFKWTASKGTLSSTITPAVEYTAPGEPGSYTVTVEVTGKGGIKEVKGITLQVVKPTPIPTATSIAPTPPPTLTPAPTNTLIPPTSTASPPPTPASTAVSIATLPAITCSCANSGKCGEQAWDALDHNNLEKVLACAQTAIKSWTREADAQQIQKASQCQFTPDPKDTRAFNDFWAKYWAVNDIATAWFLRGEAFYRQQKWAEAREAYRSVIDKYACGFAWDTNGWFWNVAEAAQSKYDEIKSK